MRLSLLGRIAGVVALLLFWVSALGCGSDQEGTSEPESSRTTGPSVSCETVTLSTSAAEPLDTLVVTGVPEAMGDSLYTTVYAPADSLTGLAFTRRTTGDSAAIRVPVHPGLRPDGGEVELTLSNGDVSCTTQRFTIQALPSARGTTSEIVDTSLVLIRQQAALFGVSSTALREAPLDQIPGPVLPLAIARRLLGEISDPESPLHPLRSGRAAVDLLDRVFAKARASEVLSAQLRGVRRAKPFVELSDESSAPTGDARSLQPRNRPASVSPFRTASYPRTSSRARKGAREGSPPSPPPQAGGTTVSGQCPQGSGPSSSSPPRQVTCAGAQIVASPSQVIPSLDAATLSTLMDLSLRGDISLDPEVVQYLDGAIQTVELGAAGFEFSAALLPTKANKAISGSLGASFGTVGVYLRLVRLLREAESKVLPRYLTGLDVRMSPARYDEDEDEIGRITTIDVRAANEGWKLDRTIVNSLLSQASIPWSKGVSKVVRPQDVSEPVQELGSTMIDEIFDDIFGRVAEAPVSDGGESTGMLACVPSETFGPVSIRSPEWSDVSIIDGQSIQKVDRLTYEPVDTGPTRYMISTEPPSDGVVRFGGQLARTCPVVDVDPIQVLVDPPAKQVEAGEEVILEAEVVHSQHPDELKWDILQGGGTVLSARQIGSNVHEARVRIPDPQQGAVMVEAKSTSDRTHLASANEKRAGTSRLHGEPVPLAGVCNPETMQQFVNKEYSGNVLINPQATDPRGMQVPNPVRVRGGGLLADGGVACSHHVGVLSEDAAEDLGLMSSAEKHAQQAARDDQALDALQRLDSLSGEGQTGGREMMEALSDLNESRTPSTDTPRDVVFQVYSPSALTFQSMGYLDDPRSAGHGGLAGWSRNAAMLVTIQLPGTAPEDLKEGGTYPARAYSPSEDGPERPGVIPTRQGFYTRWSGQTVPAPGCPSPEGAQEQQRELAACERSVNQLEQIRSQLDDVGEGAEQALRSGMKDMTEQQKKLAESFIPDLSNPYDRGYREGINCKAEVGLITFEGETEIVTGSMSGSVTIDEITDTAITGSFQLRGSGQRERTTYTLRTCGQNGQVSGHRQKTTTDPGAISIDGELHAPNHAPGLYRVDFITVSVNPK